MSKVRVQLESGWHLVVDNVEQGPGDVFEVEADRGERLVSQGVATLVEEPATKRRK